jgi:spore coat protein U-like protein
MKRLTQIAPLALVLLLVFGVVHSVEAQRFQLRTSPNNKIRLRQATGENLTIEVRYQDNAAIDYYVEITPGSQCGASQNDPEPSDPYVPRYACDGTDFVQYNLFNLADGSIVKEASEGTQFVLSGSFPTRTTGGGFRTQQFQLEARLTGGEYLAGRFSDRVRIELYVGDPVNYTSNPRNEFVNFDIEADINPSVEVAVVAAGGTPDFQRPDYTLSLGTLNAGVSGSADVVVRSNTSYSLTVTSTEGEVLTNTDPNIADSVPYDFSFDGSAYTLPAGTEVTLISSGSNTSVTGTRFPVSITIPNFQLPAQGTYQDTLSFTVLGQ